jgi:HlyD family secretion protein
LKPAAVSVDRAAVWVDTVKRGPMLRQVRGLGTLVPEDIRWIAASKEGRVEKIIVRPGATVQPDTVILELSSPDLEQLALDAESQAKTAEAELTTLRATLQRELLSQESTTAQVRSEYQQAKMEAETNESLKKNGLIADLAYKTSIIKRDELQNRDLIEQKRLEFARDSIEPQIAAKQATVDQLEASAKLKARDVEALHVKAGMTGVLQQLPVEVGQRVIAGTNLARVADPTKLKAQIKIAETQAKDIQINQPATIDTRNGLVAGHVIRVDPAVEQGTVTVDVALDGALPKGARPDLSVDGTIELERLDNVLYVGRPAFAQDGATVGVFRLTNNGEAVRTPVHFGRSSVNTIEILSGLNVNDQVILSDTSAYDSHDRIQLN